MNCDSVSGDKMYERREYYGEKIFTAQIPQDYQIIEDELRGLTVNQNAFNTQMRESIRNKKDNLESLKYKLENLNKLNNGNDIMEKDFVTLYNLQYLQNCCIIVGIIIVIVSFFKLFTPQIDEITQQISTAQPLNAINNVGNNISTSVK